VLVIGSLACLGSIAFALGAGVPMLVRCGVVLTLLFTAASVGHAALVARGWPLFRIVYTKGDFEARPLYEKWNSYSRVRVNGDPRQPEAPYTWGLSPTYPADRRVYQLHLDIDIAAGTVLTKAATRPEDLDYLAYDVTNVGYYLHPSPRVLVVGVGGGRDVLSALQLGATSVTGVEINGNVLQTLNGRFGEFTGHLDRDPRVHFVNDEARSYIARQRDQFDFIQISLIDTFAATAAGAFVLSENSLYTVEAWELFLRHLTDHGVLSVSRWNYRDRPGEIYRITALAAVALEHLGVQHPQDHLAIVTCFQKAKDGTVGSNGISTLLVSPTPLAAADVARLQAAADRMQFDMTLSPTVAADAVFARLVSGQDVGSFAAAFPVNIAPPTDDSPFFFNMLRFKDIFRLDRISLGKTTANMEAVVVLGVLALTVMFLTGLCVVLPLYLTADRRALTGAAPLVIFFAAIGLGFLMIETSQTQRLIVVLGHPTYGLTVVLFSLLLSSGAGSWLTSRVTGGVSGRAGTARLVALVSVLFVFGLLTPAIAHATEGGSTPVRIAISAGLLAVPGLFMGMAFPIGIALAGERRSALMPWLWGINGATSVCGSVLAVVIAISTTISAAFWFGWLSYLAAVGAAVWHQRRASWTSGP
jgi:hypothetical protein